MDYNYTAEQKKEIVKKLAEARGGECLDEDKADLSLAKRKIRWLCKNGHDFEATASNVRIGRWCPYCAGVRIHIQDLREIAANHEGVCLGTESVKTNALVPFRCSKGHEFEALAFRVVKGDWCPKCRKNH